MKFSLVIPVYNEAAVITPTLRSLRETFERELPNEWEILVADNASTDGTGAHVTALQSAHIRLVRLNEKGKGRALREGFKHATGEIVGFTDADLPITPEEILAAFHILEESDAGVLIGSRLHPESTMPGREWWRIGSSHMFNFLARTIVGIKVSDTQCPLKFMKRAYLDIFLATTEPTWFIDLEFIALLERLHAPLTVIPVSWDEHRYPERRSKLSTTRDGVRAVFAMARIRKNLPKQLEQLSLFQQNPQVL